MHKHLLMRLKIKKLGKELKKRKRNERETRKGNERESRKRIKRQKTIKDKIFKTKNKLTIDVTYKNKMKTYCLKCRKDKENIDPKIEQKIMD